MFCTRNGLCIERLSNGNVRILKEIAILEPNDFASFICNGSLHQENYLQFFAAMQLLGVPGYEKGWEQYQRAILAPAQIQGD